MVAMQIGCKPGKHVQRLPPGQWPRAEPRPGEERIGNLSTEEVQTLRNKGRPGAAPWADMLDVGAHNQWGRH